MGNSDLTLVYTFAKGKNIKVGFSASKKVGNSPQRHRAIRVMREAVKPLVDQMKENHYYIFVAKEGVGDKKSHEVQKSVEHILKKANLI